MMFELKWGKACFTIDVMDLDIVSNLHLVYVPEKKGGGEAQMRKTMEIEGGKRFCFDDFLSAEAVDVQTEKDNARLKFHGASIVDIIAENDERLCFIEAKNFVHLSENFDKYGFSVTIQ